MAQWTTTYAGLVSLLGTYVEDSSAEYTSAVGGCINRAEERIFKDLDLSIFNAITTASTVNGQGYITLSNTQAPVHSVYVTAAADHAQRRSREYLQAYGSSGRPLFYSADATRLYLAPTPDDSYSLDITYQVRPTPLSGSNTTNWFAENVADLLLFAALVESEHFLIAPERVSEFEQKYASLLGPARGFWRDDMQTGYEPINPTPQPERTR
jgi:hypothetical protein